MHFWHFFLIIFSSETLTQLQSLLLLRANKTTTLIFCADREKKMSTLSSRCGLLSSTTTLAPFRKGAKQSSPLVSSNFNSSSGRRKSFAISNAATISFVKGDVETSVPDVKLTKSRDGTSGTAFFTFENPDVFESATGDITGMYLSDEEGEMTTVSCCCLLYHLIARCVSYLKTSDVIASPF